MNPVLVAERLIRHLFGKKQMLVEFGIRWVEAPVKKNELPHHEYIMKAEGA